MHQRHSQWQRIFSSHTNTTCNHKWGVHYWNVSLAVAPPHYCGQNITHNFCIYLVLKPERSVLGHWILKAVCFYKEFQSRACCIGYVLTRFISWVWTMSSTKMADSWSGLRASPKENLKERSLLQGYEEDLKRNQVGGLEWNKKHLSKNELNAPVHHMEMGLWVCCKKYKSK